MNKITVTYLHRDEVVLVPGHHAAQPDDAALAVLVLPQAPQHRLSQLVHAWWEGHWLLGTVSRSWFRPGRRGTGY